MEQRTFFETDTSRPLAARLRPNTLEEFVGQRHLIGEGKILRRLIEADRISSMIFWGPPGVGKTTLARIIANSTKARFIGHERYQGDQAGHAAGRGQSALRGKDDFVCR